MATRKIRRLFPRHGGDWLYLVGLRDGGIKVGRTECPDQRARTHRQAMGGFLWVHLFGLGSGPCEHAAIAAFVDAGAIRPTSARETFAGIEREAAIRICRALIEQRRLQTGGGLNDFNEVMRRCGGVATVAAALGESIQTVVNWRTRGFPPGKCKAIEAITGIDVRRLRPDDWQDFWPIEETAKG